MIPASAGAAAGGAAAAAAAAAAALAQQQEEEEMSSYQPGDLEAFEFKILRNVSGEFKDAAKLRGFLDEEAKAGWELVEKFDNNRIRLKRRLDWRTKDADLGWDAYRTNAGITEGMYVARILLCIFAGIATVGAIIAIIVAGLKK